VVDSTNAFLPEPIYKTEARGVKVATPDILLDNESLSLETMGDYVFAEIGGIEILSVSRHDLINSPYNRGYTPLGDAGTVFRDQQAIVFIDGSRNIFNTYTIDLNYHIPQIAENALIENDLESGNITINLKNLQQDYIVEVEILSAGTVVNDTI
jgi:hypothetical protein